MGFLGGTVGVPNPNDAGMQAHGPGREPVRSAFLAWGDPVTDPPEALGELHFDVVISEDHERDSEVSDHSIESGSSITDHVRPLPDAVTLNVFVSNTPISSPDAQLAPFTLDIPQPGQGSFLAGGTSALLTGAAAALGLTKSYPTQLTAMVQQFDGEKDFVENAYNTLTELRDTATLLTVVTPRQVYSNMILKRIGMHRDSGTGTSAMFELELRQIRIVNSEIVDAPLPSILRATPALDQGKKDPTAAPEPKKSVALKASLDAGVAVGNGQASNAGFQ